MAKRTVTYQGVNYDLSYEIINPSASKTILFLHGWGSNKEVMKVAFAKHFKTYRHLYLDMPGFGESRGEAILTTADYAAIIALFLETVNIKPDAIFGHSFGGKVATLLAPPLLVLLSSAGVVPPKPLNVRLKIALFKALKPLGGANLYKLFATKDANDLSRTMYETLKKVVNEDFTKIFSAYQGKTAIFWGKDDRATPLSSGKQIATLIHGSKFFILDGDHYFFLKQGGLIEETLAPLLS
ncbi:MAG: alpha/beta hydrolase [Campylobacterales bacterium]